ncbi:hypothetical protein [Kitasatospora arboriphila]
MVVAGWLIQGADYVPGFLLQIGSTLVLIVPIALLERRLTGTEQNTEALGRELREVGEQLGRTAEQVQQLGRLSLEDGFSQRDAALREAESRPGQQSVARALREAQTIGAVSAKGVRVAPEGHPDSLRFRPVAGSREGLDVRVESPDGAKVSDWQAWRPGEHDRKVCRRLDAAARTAGLEPQRLAALPVSSLIALVRLAVSRHSGEGRDLGAVVQAATAEWVVSDEGLYGRQLPYRIPRQVLERELAPAELDTYRARNTPLADPAGLATAVACARAAYRAEQLGPGSDPGATTSVSTAH